MRHAGITGMPHMLYGSGTNILVIFSAGLLLKLSGEEKSACKEEKQCCAECLHDGCCPECRRVADILYQHATHEYAESHADIP